MIPTEERSVELGNWKPVIFFRGQQVQWFERVTCNQDLVVDTEVQVRDGKSYQRVRFCTIEYLAGLIFDPESGKALGVSQKIPGKPKKISRDIEVVSVTLPELISV